MAALDGGRALKSNETRTSPAPEQGPGQLRGARIMTLFDRMFPENGDEQPAELSAEVKQEAAGLRVFRQFSDPATDKMAQEAGAAARQRGAQEDAEQPQQTS
jgi:hypothetical protein